MPLTENLAQPFTESMWDCYSGAEPWPNGDNPVFRQVGEYIIVIDSQAITAIDDDAEEEWEMPLKLPNQYLAALLLNSLPENVNPFDLGLGLRCD